MDVWKKRKENVKEKNRSKYIFLGGESGVLFFIK